MRRPSSDLRLVVMTRGLAVQRSEILADFEMEVLAAAWQRRALMGDGWSLTPAERQVIEDALAAMIAAGHQELAA